MRRLLLRVGVFALSFVVVGLCATAAQACPMCNQSIAEENALPRAYMYSILFMLGMPATVFTAFGIFLYRQFRARDAAQAALLAGQAAPRMTELPAGPQLAGQV